MPATHKLLSFSAAIAVVVSQLILCVVPGVEKLLQRMQTTQSGVRFADLAKVCDHFFGDPRQQGTAHRVYRMPWPGDPRVNIQDDHGKAKAYQVRQVLAAIEKLEGEVG